MLRTHCTDKIPSPLAPIPLTCVPRRQQNGVHPFGQHKTSQSAALGYSSDTTRGPVYGFPMSSQCWKAQRNTLNLGYFLTKCATAASCLLNIISQTAEITTGLTQALLSNGLDASHTKKCAYISLV